MITPGEFADIVDRAPAGAEREGLRDGRDRQLHSGVPQPLNFPSGQLRASVSLIQAHDLEPLARQLEHVAEVIDTCSATFLEGDRRSFDSARRIRASLARAYTAPGSRS